MEEIEKCEKCVFDVMTHVGFMGASLRFNGCLPLVTYCASPRACMSVPVSLFIFWVSALLVYGCPPSGLWCAPFWFDECYLVPCWFCGRPPSGFMDAPLLHLSIVVNAVLVGILDSLP